MVLQNNWSKSKTYLIINISLIIIFLIALLCFYHFEVSCFYKEKYNVICKTCGITRDFKKLLAFEDENLINPLSKVYFTFFFSFFLMRFIACFLILKKVKFTPLIDILIIISFFGYILFTI